MDLTVFINAQDILAFREGQFVVLQDRPQHGVPVTGPIDEFEIIGFPLPEDVEVKRVRWRSAGGVRKPSPFSYW